MTKFSRAIAAAALAGLAMPNVVIAQEESVAVTFADLDLASEEGKAELRQRLHKATKQVCDEEQQVGSRIGSKEKRACYRQARTQAAAQFDAIVARASKGG